MPSRVVHTEEVARLCGITTEEAIRRSGVVTRHWLSKGEDPLDLGVEAAHRALESANLSVADVDVIINASGMPLQPIPDDGSIIAAAC
jgi:3-oxoacyl-[acyl-carrier-protein] synthase III